MAQLRLKDFFNVKGVQSGSQSAINLTLAERPEVERADNISFHSFTVYKSFDNRQTACHINDASMTVLSDTKIRPRKISDFNEYMLDRELVALTPPMAPDKSPAPELINRPIVRQPFHPLQLKQGQNARAPKLDEYFQSKVIVNKVL